jgi:predicted RNA methylase
MDIWSNVEYVFLCLKDRKRTEKFREAIETIVKPGDNVLELGTGSGILALFAAKAGARKVSILEVGKYLFRNAGTTFKVSQFKEQIDCYELNAIDLHPELIPKPDVVICEMVTTGLISEMQFPVIQQLRKRGIIAENTRLIPQAFETSIQLVQADFEFYGYTMRTPLFINYFFEDKKRRFAVMSKKTVLIRVDMSEVRDNLVREEVTLTINKPGLVNGILVTTKTDFGHGIILEDSISYCQPVILPIEEMRFQESDQAKVSLTYKMGEGFDGLECKCQKLIRSDDFPLGG